MSAHLRPIFVVGVGHSGTSILYKMLAWHPDLGWFSQYSQRGGQIPGRKRIPCYWLFNRWGRRLFPHSWKKNYDKMQIIPRPGESRPIWNYIMPLNSTLPVEEISQRMRRILDDEARAWKCNRLIFKNPAYSTQMNLLKSIFPSSKFVHIVRDGRAVSLSRADKGQLRGENTLGTLKNAGNDWAKTIASINGQKDGDSLLEIRYEDFCMEPKKHILNILDFLELDKGVFPIYRCPSSLTITNSKYYTNLGSNELDVLESTMQKWLDYYKYEPLDSLR